MTRVRAREQCIPEDTSCYRTIAAFVEVEDTATKRALVLAILAVEYVDLAAFPLSGQHDGHRSGKPSSRPPSGNSAEMSAERDVCAKLRAIDKRAHTLAVRMSETDSERKAADEKTRAILNSLRDATTKGAAS